MADESEISHWSELPNCLLDLISSMLKSDSDFLRFGRVCTSWRSVFLENIDSRRSRRQPPMLLIPLVADSDSNCSSTTTTNDYNVKNKEEYEKEHKDTMHKRSLYSVKEEKVCEFQLSIPDNTYCIGSSFGWLVTVPMYDENYPVRLLNPFLPTDDHMNEIELPSLHTLPPDPSHNPVEWYWYMVKAVLSANPTTESDYTVMAIYGGYTRLAFWKPGDSKWTSIGKEKHEWTSDSEMHSLFQDVIYHKGQFYAINQRGYVYLACDIDGACPKLRKFSKPPLRTFDYNKKYIIESSSGNLFQIHRDVELREDRNYETIDFQVFKLLSSSCDDDQIDDKDDEEKESKWLKRKWTEVHSLDGSLFFIGNNASVASDSICVSTECNKNCIYFTDDSPEFYTRNLSVGPHDMEVYDLEDETYQPHYHREDTCCSSFWPNPIWIQVPFGWEPSVLCCKGRRNL